MKQVPKSNKQQRPDSAPEKVALPTPLELAKLASAFLPDDCKDRGPFSLDLAITEAARLYLRACRFHEKHKDDTLEKFAEAVGDPTVFLDQYAARARGRTFYLEPDKKTDSARQYLAEQKLPLKTVKSVLKNLRQMTWFNTCEHALRQAGKMPELPTGLTQKEKDEAYELEATRLGLVEQASYEELWGKSVFPAMRERRPDGCEVYAVSEMPLSLMVQWKKARKRTGGDKSVEGQSAEKSSKKMRETA